MSSRHIRARRPNEEATGVAAELFPPIEKRLVALDDAIKRLFERACAEVGVEHARLMFGEYGKPRTPKQRERLKKLQLKTMLELAIKLGWTDYKLAHHLAKQNKTLPPDQRWEIRDTRKALGWYSIWKALGRLKEKPARKRSTTHQRAAPERATTSVRPTVDRKSGGRSR